MTAPAPWSDEQDAGAKELGALLVPDALVDVGAHIIDGVVMLVGRDLS